MTEFARPVLRLLIAATATLLATSLQAQQPNSPQASMVWMGIDGPSWPIVASQAPPNALVNLEFRAAVGASPILLAHARAGLLPTGVSHPELGGLVDLDFSQGFDVLIDGFTGAGNVWWFPGAPGTYSTGVRIWNIQMPAPAHLHLPGLQAVLGSPSTPTGLLLTAATDLTLYPECATGMLGGDFSQATQVPPYVGGAMQWNGTSLELAYESNHAGDGSDGVITFGPGVHDIDTTPGANASPCTTNTFHAQPGGVLNASSIVVSPGAVIRAYGTHPLRWRSTGSVSIHGVIDCSAFRLTTDATCYGRVPANGQYNNPSSSPIVAAGEGGPGGGRGGRASHHGSARSYRGENGHGPLWNGIPNPGPPSDPRYGGGAGGHGGVYYNTLTPPPAPLLGGFGGAGGSAFTRGGDGLPRSALGVIPPNLCGAPVTGPLPRPVAVASPPSLAFVPPLSDWTAGSGGGGGGDKFDPFGPSLDEQGGGGGGGGGCFHLVTAGNVTIGSNAVILAQGSPGSTGPTFTGTGGSGSGGLVWIQCKSSLAIDPNATLDVSGGGHYSGNIHCLGAPGLGGTGYIQLEDSDGIVNTNFNVQPSLAQSNHLGVLTYIGNTHGTAISAWLDSGVSAPSYNGTVIVSDLGSMPSASLKVEFQGAPEDPQNPGHADPLNAGTWALAGQINNSTSITDPLDGFRFVRYRITASYFPSPLLASTYISPRIDVAYICF